MTRVGAIPERNQPSKLPWLLLWWLPGLGQVLFLKDINLPRPDKYDTCALIAFLQQLVTFNGFYDEHLEFLGIERVHIVR